MQHCVHRHGRITSVSAMVFMQDSERAAGLARSTSIDVGLHLNLTELFSAPVGDAVLLRCHERVRAYLTARKYAFLVYNPALRREFQVVFEAQRKEFVRLYGRDPSHIDGHHHQHLCANILLGSVIPAGQKLRRGFFFWPGRKKRRQPRRSRPHEPVAGTPVSIDRLFLCAFPMHRRHQDAQGDPACEEPLRRTDDASGK